MPEQTKSGTSEHEAVPPKKTRRVSNKRAKKTTRKPPGDGSESSPEDKISDSPPPSEVRDGASTEPPKKNPNHRRRANTVPSQDSRDETTAAVMEDRANPENAKNNGPKPQPGSSGQKKSSMDPAELATKAWKIYLAEVSEEGVSLIRDNDARELARRCFRLAEIFLDEKSKH